MAYLDFADLLKNRRLLLLINDFIKIGHTNTDSGSDQTSTFNRSAPNIFEHFLAGNNHINFCGKQSQRSSCFFIIHNT